MPIYEYQCEECGHNLEAIQKFSDAPLTECPSCGKESLKKLVSAAAFKLKGGGWYETDFKNKSTSKCGSENSSNNSENKSSSKGALSKDKSPCEGCPNAS